ncbi:hypothetical protein [Pelagibacterium montanilacus]|uniref:hypothetical protein n=1 Tax=Pelagibacterium montanilacus TaxID=2185280 RepID=UPI0013E06F62|nr:hypothetical protein [Pelagibacterium montanilacus]
MTKDDQKSRRVENMNAGEHLGGTHFGQGPSATGANPAKAKKDASDNPDKAKSTDKAGT